MEICDIAALAFLASDYVHNIGRRGCTRAGEEEEE
jgi:hypothetical protein